MTQRSRPQADNISTSATYLDSGPYSRNQWADKIIVENVGDEVTNRGPYYGYLNALEVTNPAGVTIRVDTGAGIVGGSFLFNSATFDLTPDTPAIAARIDKVVMVENNTNAAYDGTPSAVILDIPAALADYNLLQSVPPYSARLAILRGDDATGAATALVQTTNYWMIELARFTISNVPAVSALTDNRDFVDAETKQVFVDPLYGRNTTDSTDIALGGGSYSTAYGASIELPNSKAAYGAGRFLLPLDYIKGATVTPMILPKLNSGNLISGTVCDYGTCTQSPTTHTDTLANAATAVTASTINCINELTLSVATVDDVFIVRFNRDATDPNDTVNDNIFLIGFRLEYFGWR